MRTANSGLRPSATATGARFVLLDLLGPLQQSRGLANAARPPQHVLDMGDVTRREQVRKSAAFALAHAGRAEVVLLDAEGETKPRERRLRDAQSPRVELLPRFLDRLARRRRSRSATLDECLYRRRR